MLTCIILLGVIWIAQNRRICQTIRLCVKIRLLCNYNVDFMLGQRDRRWTNIEITLGESLLAGLIILFPPPPSPQHPGTKV